MTRGESDASAGEGGVVPLEGFVQRLREAGVMPQRARGQHFLHDPAIIDAIVEAAEIPAGATVLEIGTGPATLTRRLADVAQRVVTVEVDPRMAAFARRELRGCSNVELVEADALGPRGTLAPPVAEALDGIASLWWVSNLPYGVASPLMLAFLRAGLPWRRAVLMVQAEVAARLRALPGGSRSEPARHYGPLTVLVAFWARVELVRRVRAGSFWPPPRVESAVVRLDPRSDGPPVEIEPRVRQWVGVLLGQRRKQLGRLLRGALGADRARLALARGAWDPSWRPDALGLEDFLLLAREFPLPAR